VDKVASAGIRSADRPDRMVSLNYVLPRNNTTADPEGQMV
jgi:hypothetical protein